MGVTLATSLGLVLLWRGTLGHPKLKNQSAPPSLAREPTQSPVSVTTTAPLPTSPGDQELKTMVGPIELVTWNPVTITGLESGTNLFFTATNTSSQIVTLAVPTPGDPGSITVPPTLSIKHFFGFQDRTLSIAPGRAATIEYLIAPDGDGQGKIPFTFTIQETGITTTIPVSITVTASLSQTLSQTIQVTGRLLSDAGQPVVRADVKIFAFSGRLDWRTETDDHGQFRLAIPSMEDVKALLGQRRLPYHDLDFFLTAETKEGGFVYQGGIAPQRGQEITLDLVMPSPAPITYTERANLNTDGAYGYWWLLPNRDFSQLVASQGRHTPLKDRQTPGHLIGLDRAGIKKWQLTTPSECWGLATSAEGEVVAGCRAEGGQIIRVSRDGRVLWTLEGGGENRWTNFSPDGKEILTGPVPAVGEPHGRADAALLDAVTGKVRWSYAGADEWLRAARFGPDGERILAGFSGGRLVMFTRAGQPLWETWTGEFPLVLELDEAGNSYASGKNREVTSFDAAGNPRWRYRIPDHVVTAGSNNLSQDGKLLVVGTVGGWLYAFDADGTLAWRRHLPPIAQGHNALDITPDGQFILVGTNGEQGGYFLVYRREGTLLWQTQFFDTRPSLVDRGDHNDTGVITVAISDDGQFIAAGTGDSTIRIFERE